MTPQRPPKPLPSGPAVRLAACLALIGSAPGSLAQSTAPPDPQLLASPPGHVRFFRGSCDASAVLPLGTDHTIVADDEDNVLRIYPNEGGMPSRSLDLSRFLRVDPADPEVDIEAAARLGDTIYWVSSHGRNRKGLLRPSRHRFFATRIVPDSPVPTVQPIGSPSARLVRDLLADPRLANFNLRRASTLPPKARDALNIEGLTALPDGRLLLGFRNPQPAGMALLIPLNNPAEVITGQPFAFGEPILLDLGQRGIRGLASRHDQVLILAGAHDDTPRTRLFIWKPGEPEATPLPQPAIPASLTFNPEGLEPQDQTDSQTFLLASDDGTVRINNRECKRLRDPAEKRFRTLILTP